MDNNLKRELIIDNFENPFHKEIKDTNEFIKANTHNESCIDNIDLYVKIDGDMTQAGNAFVHVLHFYLLSNPSQWLVR